MIYEVDGDILFSNADAIAHGIAAMDPMSQGLALSLHERYPAMHKEFHHWCHQKHPKPGDAWMWSGPNGVRIINLITQEGGYGHGARPGKAKTTHVNRALRALKKLINKEKLGSIALPQITTGVGGLLWEEVRPLIENQLGDLDIPVILYTNYIADQPAKEPSLKG